MTHAPHMTQVTHAPQRHRIVATAGHVDHGKSTLLHALTGMRPERLAEERRRGMTIDLGFVWTALDDPASPGTPLRVAFVDVPGHERFVGTMLAGTGAGPGVILVVSADGGWSAQSSEHRDILDLLGCRAVALVITKADLVDEERLALVRDDVVHRTAGTSLAGAPLVVTDAVSGRGMAELRSTLVERLRALPGPADLGRPRLWVDRSFAPAGAGTVVTGTLVDGFLAPGDRGRLLPDGTPLRIRTLQMLGEEVDLAPPGSRVAAGVAGLSHREVARGRTIVLSDAWRVTTELDVELRLLDGRELGRRGAWRLHAGTAGVGCRVRLAYGPLEPGGTGAVRLVLDEPLALAVGDRVVLRELGRRATVGGGRVLDPAPTPLPRGRAARVERAERLARLAAAATVDDVMTGLVALSGGMRAFDEVVLSAGRATAVTSGTSGTSAPSGERSTDDLPPGLRRVGEQVAERRLEERLRAAVRGVGPGLHERGPLTRLLVEAGAPRAVASTWLEELVADGTLARSRHGFSLPEHADAERSASASRQERVVAVLAAGGIEPPPFEQVAGELGLTHLERSSLLAGPDVVRAGPIVFARAPFDEATQRLRELEAEHGPFTASMARERLATTRKYAIPLLEALRAQGLTAFDGHAHRFAR